MRKEPVTSLSNAQLLCNHGGLVHRPSPDADSDPKYTHFLPLKNKIHNFVYTETNPVVCVYVRFVYLWPYEWETLSKYAVNDSVVLLKRTVLEGGTISLIIEPGT